MKLAITINTLIRDIFKQCQKVRLIEDEDYKLGDIFDPYEYLSKMTSADSVSDMFLFDYGETILASRESLTHPKVSIELTKFMHWAEENGIGITLVSNDKGVCQLYTIQLLTSLCEGQFTNFDKFDFRFSKERTQEYDFVVHDMPSLDGLGNALILDAPHTKHMAGERIDGFNQLKEYLECQQKNKLTHMEQ